MNKTQLSEMSLREKIKQMMLPCQYDCSSYKNTSNTAGYTVKEHFDSYRTDYKNTPALISFDTDNADHISCNLSVTCPPLAVGAADSEELAFELGTCIARELRCTGANWIWGPCVDIAHRFSPYSMKTFAPDDSDRLIRLSNAYIRGIQSECIAATAKHFPGNDRNDYRDACFSPTVNSSDMAEWNREQGKIFREIINGGVYSVMVGHMAFPAYDNSILKGRFRPSTVSKKIVSDLLKGKLGFNGVVVTDDITASSLTCCYNSYEELIIDLVNAGNDILIGTCSEAGDIIEHAVKEGRIPISRIDDASGRILDMKEKIGLFGDDYLNLPYNAGDAASKTQKVKREIARRAITFVRDNQNLLPIDKSKIKNVTIVCSSHVDIFFSRLEYMKKAFEDRGINVHLQKRIKDDAEMNEIDKNSDLIIYAVYVAPNQPRGHMGLYGDECTTYLYAFSKGQTKSIGISMGYPYIHYDVLGNAETFINSYGFSPELMEACVEAIFGEIEIKGISPVKIIPDPLWN